MLEIEIDGKRVEVPDGSTVMDAANRVGTYIPHFCYHKKLSIAANCRMCLVDVEKAPKPLPACATPVTNGMKVTTSSEKAVNAQKGVMEFLLINHPLDCPICDQGGECQLQDLAVGYGGSSSRYQEEKRVVVNKNLGPLISTDMTRCIHCTRCVRFGQEVAGIMELGVANRGERSEIMAFVDRSVDSELSGNVIDLCPVGALTSKPFRFSARSWEMSRRRSVSPHDSLGSNLAVQVKHDQVKRVLPLENDAINECWLSDRDRFSYEALACDDRLSVPMVKQDGNWIEATWEQALDYAKRAISGVVAEHGVEAFGAFISPNATLEELYLTQSLVRSVGSENVDFRLRQCDFSIDALRAGVPWLGLPVGEIAELDAALVIGSVLRKDHPLFAQRLRLAAKRGALISLLGSIGEDPLMPLSVNARVAPSRMVGTLAAVATAVAKLKRVDIAADIAGLALPPCQDTDSIARDLVGATKPAVLLGNGAVQHPSFGLILGITGAIGELLNCPFGAIGEAANSVGGYFARAFSPKRNVETMLADPCKAVVLVGVEPLLDFADGVRASAALKKADTVIALTSFRSAVEDVADLMLPMAAFAETSGTYVNCEGRPQSFNAAVKPKGEARPGWKILRVLGELLGHDVGAYPTSERVRDLVLEKATALSNQLSARPSAPASAVNSVLERAAYVQIYGTDAVVRRASSLQRTKDAATPQARISPVTLASLGVMSGAKVRVTASGSSLALVAVSDDSVAEGCVCVAAGCNETAPLGPLFGHLTVEAL
ncbi:NADH-quinone oxidoreductase subunit NuoG [Niveibacterium sp. 24ML]|uniref:NADH-quinone oxidoreductase subunit NuoG n=1 Tax=Niveibacterium sp. 24ML TaxID=2985512 RepID=UPI00227038C0|nr:NADH-quinone oxidoreductase subunit NuoG [Niveibacterium sp. 24ML]MCX9155186.1 NADH-quinone oxidoreductase subunit NuoG [Niveibacterium sp. 24ML]